jgi:TetR/AcrR family transcriptional repressor of nem operon
VHRNSLYKTFGSKRGLYLAALRRHLDDDITPLLARIGAADHLTEAVNRALAAEPAGTGLDLLLLAAVDRAPADPEVAALVTRAMAALDAALTCAAGSSEGGARPSTPTTALTAAILGLRLRARAGAPTDASAAAAALAGWLGEPGQTDPNSNRC